MKLALSLAVILGLALVSQAAFTPVVVTEGPITVTVAQDTVTPSTASGTTAYIVTLSSANNIAAVDGRIDAATGGYLYQTWYVNSLPTPDGENLSPTNLKNDTHILVPVPSQVAVRSPDEDLVNFDYPDQAADPNHLHDGTTLCGTNGNVVGDGTNDFSKTMAFGLITSTNLTQLSNVPFARVVLNATSNPLGFTFDFDVVDGESNKETFDFNPMTVPEPMTLSLIAVGGLALIRRRR